MSQSKLVPDSMQTPLGLIYSRGTLGRAVPVPHRYYLHFSNLRYSFTYILAVRLTIKPLPLPTSALVRFTPIPIPTTTFLSVLPQYSKTSKPVSSEGSVGLALSAKWTP